MSPPTPVQLTNIYETWYERHVIGDHTNMGVFDSLGVSANF
jgi:hypothetical protein